MTRHAESAEENLRESAALERAVMNIGIVVIFVVQVAGKAMTDGQWQAHLYFSSQTVGPFLVVDSLFGYSPGDK